MQAAAMDWANPAIGPFPMSFESPTNMLQQLPITLPPSAYDPTFGNTIPFLNSGASFSPLNGDLSTVQAISAFHEAFGQSFADPVTTNDAHVQNARSSPNLWGGFALTKSFSSLDSQSDGAYTSSVMLDGSETSFQCPRPPSRHQFSFVPIFDNVAPPNSVLVPEPDMITSTTLYPQQAMPLTVEHPELSPNYQQHQTPFQPPPQASQYSQPAPANLPDSGNQPWAQLLENVTRMEKAQNVDPQKLIASASQRQTALNLPMHQSQTSPFTYQQQAVLFQQRLLEHEQDLAQQLLLEQQRQMQHYPTFRSSPKEESPPNQIMPQTSHPSTPSTSGDVSTLYQETAFIHDFMAEDRLNIGAKENQLLPSGLPSIPSLSVRTPAPRSHPYSSPRLSGITSPRGTGLSLDRKGSLRSVRPLVPRGTVGSLKRESLSSTTAYVAGLRRPIPSLAAAMSALERTPIDPYGRATVTPFGPINFYGPSTAGNPGITGSASTASTSLPPESPLPSTSTGGFESPGTQRASIIGAPASPFKELSSPLAPTDNSLRLHRGGGSVGNAPVRPSTASTVDMRSSPPLYASPVQGSSSKVLPSAASLDRVQSQTRATASRKRADDDILNHSFRAEGDWRRRAVLDNVLTASFVMDNIMEPNCTGADDPITMGLGSEGKSVYAVFLEQTERSQWRCLFGDKDFPCGSQATSFKRLERALDHVRSHLNHRPYACKGECQKGDSCDARFFARSHLQDHLKRTESACCETCGQVIRIQNMNRHRMAH